MDEETRTRIAGRVIEVSDSFYSERIAYEIERALELVPQPLGDRVRLHDSSVVVELVTETRLFTAVIDVDDRTSVVVVQLSSRRLDDGLADVEMKQHGGRRFWTFRFGGDDSISADGRTLPEVINDDERFAQALAGRLGWVPPDATAARSSPPDG
jgi:hypothetical protein